LNSEYFFPGADGLGSGT